MTNKRFALSFGFLLFATFLFSQVEVIGEMRLGDTTQVHVINTKKGDRMVGRVVGFDDTEIKFLMLGNKITFPITEVENIMVTDAPIPIGKIEESRNFVYKLTAKSGKVYRGKFISYIAKKIYLYESGTKKSIMIKADEVKSMTNIGDDMIVDGELPGAYHAIKMYQGQPLEGQVASFKNGRWKFRVASGDTLSFSNKQLLRIDLLGEKIPSTKSDNQYAPSLRYPGSPIHAPTKNFVAPTAFMLGQGQSEYRNTQILFNNVEHGLSKNFTIGGSFATLFAGSSVGLKMKLGASLTEKAHVAIGGTMNYLFGQNIEGGGVFTYYSAFTLGSPEYHLTVSLGRFSNPDSENYNTITLAGSTRIGQKGRIFVEYNRITETGDDFIDDAIILNIGGSWFKGRNRVDFGFTVTGDVSYLVPFPIAAYSLYF